MKGIVVVVLLVAVLGLWVLGSVGEAPVEPAGVPGGEAPGEAASALVAGEGHASDAAPGMPEPLPAGDRAALEVSAASVPTVKVHVRATLPSVSGGEPPAAGHRLEVGVSRSHRPLGEALLAVVTDELGLAHAELPWSAFEAWGEAKGLRVWVRSQGDGWKRTVVSTRAPAQPGGECELRIRVQRVVLVEGLLLGRDGKPVAGMANWWHLDGERSQRGGNVRAGSDGRFRAELLVEGTHGFHAQGTSDAEYFGSRLTWRFDLGTGFSDLFDVRFGEPVPLIEVPVSGPGRLQGHVLDGRGEAAAGLKLAAVLAELDDEAGSLDFPYPRAHEVMLEGRGHYFVEVVTDARGAFVFRGLRADLYNLRARVGESRRRYPLLLTEQPVSSQGGPLELRLTRPHLAIHVRRSDGSPPGEGFVAHRATRWSKLEAWPEQAGLLVTLTPDAVRTASRYAPYLEAQAVGPGEFIVELDAGLSVDVGVLGGAVPWVPQHVDLPAGAGRVDVDLVLPPEVPGGALVLEVADAVGEPLVEDLRVRVRSSGSAVVLLDKSFKFGEAEDWPQHFELPAGEYVLLVEGHPNVGNQHGTLSHPRGHGAYETPLRIEPGVETRVRAPLGAGARLHLRLLGETTEADRDAVRAEGDDLPEGYVAFWAPSVHLRLEREGRWPERVDFARYWGKGSSAAGTHLFPSLDMGAEATSELLTPGTYTLVARTQGGRTIRRPVQLAPGSTLDVTLVFD